MLWIRQRIKTNVLYKGKVEVITSEVLRSPHLVDRYGISCHKWPRICSTCRKHFLFVSSFMTWFVTRLARRVPLVEQGLLIFPEQLSSPPVFSGVRVTRSLVLCVCFVDRCLSFCTIFVAIVFSVLPRYTDSDYTFGIFKLSHIFAEIFAWSIFHWGV